jgi:hypothetical protein
VEGHEARFTGSDAAQLLAELLDDQALWATASEPPGDSVAREALARTAADVYRATFPVLVERAAVPRTEFDRAITLARDIADRCAVLSQEWTTRELRRWWSNLVTRTRAEEELRLSKLDAWSEEQGVPLNLGQSGHEEVRIFRRLWRARASKSEIADDFVLVEREYAAAHEQSRRDPARLQAGARLAHGAAGLIGKSRNNLLAAMGMHDLAAEAVAEATLMLAQGLFVISQDRDASPETEREQARPDAEFLRQFLTVRGGASWIKAHAKKLPDWMR